MDACITRVTDDFYFIERGWLNGNHFVQTGPEVVLIDSGYLTHWPRTEELIRQTGARVEEVKRLITTHSHCDHIGGAAEIAARSGCEVAMHQVDQYFINQRNGWATWAYYYHHQVRFFPVHLGLEQGDYLRLAGLDWQVIHAPGHGMGQICLFAPDSGWLIAADAAWDGDFGVLTTRIEGLDSPFKQRETLKRLAKLPVSIMFPGHGPIINNGRTAIGKCLERINLYIEEPKRMARDQMNKMLLFALMMEGPLLKERFLPYLLKTKWFPEISQLYFDGQGETAYRQTLEYLVERGLVREDDGQLTCNVTK
jgi:hydroxyacylglutathione hydrolase